MNKSILFMAGIIGLALTACDDKSDLGTMQVNQQPAVIAANGVAIESRFLTSGVNQINLDNYQNVNVPLFDIAISDEFPAEATVTGVLQVASHPDFSDAVEMELTSTDKVAVQDPALGDAIQGGSRMLVGEVFGNDWEDAFVELYGNAPYNNTNYLRFKLYTTIDTQKTIIYADNNGTEWWPAMTFDVTPVDLKLDVEGAYNFVWTSGSDSGVIPMYHGEGHHYDNPEFTVMFEVSDAQAAAGYKFNIVSAADPSKVYGVASGFEADASTARLALGSQVQAVVANAGSYKLTADMLTKIYSIGVAPKTLYVIGLGQQFANVAQLPTTDYVTYEGTAGVLGKWCVTGQGSYRPTVFYVDGFSRDDAGVMSGKIRLSSDGTPLQDGNGCEFPSGKAGLSYFRINVQEMTFEATPLLSIGLCGTMTGWKDGADVQLKSTRSSGYMTWTGDVTLEAGAKLKIRANGEWNFDWGVASGTVFEVGTPIQTGLKAGDLEVTEAGSYKVTVDFKAQPATITFVKK